MNQTAPFIEYSLGSVHGCHSPTPVGPDIERQWKLLLKTGSWTQYLAAAGMLVGALANKRGFGAWSVATGELIWSAPDIVWEMYIPYAIAGDYVFVLQVIEDHPNEIFAFRLDSGEPKVWDFGESPKLPLGIVGDELLIDYFSAEQPSIRRIGLDDEKDHGALIGYASMMSQVATWDGDAIAKIGKGFRDKRYVSRVDPSTGECKWVYENAFCCVVCQAGPYALLSDYWFPIREPAAVIDLRSGTKLWELPKRVPFHYDNGYVYADDERDLLVVVNSFGEQTDSIWCRSLRTGELKWEHRTMAESFGYPIADASASLWVTGDILWHVDATDFDKRFLVARNVTTGEELNRVRMPGRSRYARILCVDSGILVIRDGQSLYGYASR